MSIRIILTLLFSVGLAALSVYVYTLLDPRLEVIVLKNEEIMRLDNKIADLTEANEKMSVQVSSISTVVKSNEKDSGKINDEYKVCLRKAKRQKKTVLRLKGEISVLQNKNKIMRDYVKVNNDVTSLKEQIAALNLQKKSLTEELGDNLNKNLDTEGGASSGAGHSDLHDTPVAPAIQ